jgi:hypothetical protein
MKISHISVAFLALISTCSLFAQDEDDLFGGYADSVKKMEAFSIAQKAKATRDLQDILVPVFKSHTTATNMRFNSVGGETLIVLNTGEGGIRVEELLSELQGSLNPSEETESEDWVQIRTPEFDLKELKVFILFPDLPRDDVSPFYGIRIYDKDEAISELYFSNRTTARKWVALIEELQATMNKKRQNKPEMATPRKPSD